MSQPQRVYGDVPVQVDERSLRSEKNVTLDEILDMADEIFAQVRSAGYTSRQQSDFPAIDQLYSELYEQYQDFVKEFPLIFRWMVHMQKYNKRAFRIYLEKQHKSFWKDRETFLKAQVEYLIYLFRIENRKCSVKTLQKQREAYRKWVLEEHKKFKEAGEETKEVIKKREEERLNNIREALRAALLARK